MTDDKAWFEPKRRGYGAGRPIAWQGWASIAAWALVLLLGGLLVMWDREIGAIAALALVVPATAVLVYIAAIKTRGGWRWRWGGDD
ncbi:hypothetical protein [Qipengyuania qiaonensis]|uniref:DUF2530 domain-containing protein n=1 Tax=Qipengyuania qiaonensis TaxID=2867240 RepID=A0ABS7J3C8_9SPHN|nr:hypothetical protein [Qipengyuania qiaonensis]MBX7481824.1 hypothetical protein [Qipengyuania qiaonensis]